ncbi:Ada metal-binding domain-containing protein [Flavivirga jejuensis]|uniref:Ada metal-binding domain-containing protein n=1 Tax=Flavivirga jejuensis TaxID=870487 RepID=A0ABT8WIZ9_9FLAO|nr:Ada metal-binding domain-containing protein [Flavivirga jejuensis]MDO5972942.1 Ada metal-binding domain-containing protein [Flavivirga jejuensis]
MIKHNDISDTDLRAKIKTEQILFGGNKNLKIYGRLNCKSGMRMKRENRVFFSTEKEALKNNFRPCGHCMRVEYKKWKYGIV